MKAKKKYFRLSWAQKVVLITRRLNSKTSAWNIPCVFHLGENTDEKQLAKAINHVIASCDVMRFKMRRTIFGTRQYAEDFQEREIKVIDLAHSPEEARRWIKRAGEQPFPLYGKELFQVVILRLAGGQRAFYLKVDHLISDGWGVNLIAEDIYNSYLQLLQTGRVEPVERPSYEEYLKERQEYSRSEIHKKKKKYFVQKIQNFHGASNLVSHNIFNISMGSNIKITGIDQRFSDEVESFCKRYHFSINVLLLSAIALYLSKESGKNEVALNIIFHNRLTGAQKQMVGLMALNAPIRFKIEKEETALMVMKKIFDEFKEMVKYRNDYPVYPGWFTLRHFVSIRPFFGAISVAYEDFVTSERLEWVDTQKELGPLIIRLYGGGAGILKPAPGESLSGRYFLKTSYLKKYFEPVQIDQIAGEIIALMNQIIKDPEARVKDF